ncbi:MAG: hypothetical protein H6717_27820 [Polyangiaceae bacterium]|nr:hypothetical protein [Polyangiaceae bacterium]
MPVSFESVKRALALLGAVLWVACSSSDAGKPTAPALADLSITQIAPTTLVAGTTLVVTGSFGDVTLPILELTGVYQGEEVTLKLPGDLVAADRIEVPWSGGLAQGLSSDDGQFTGRARMVATGPVDGRQHVSPKVDAALDMVSKLDPKFFLVFEGTIFVNDEIAVEGDNFLLGGAEGQTVAIVEGCFTKQGDSTCTPISDVEIPMRPDPPVQRKKATFPFAPKIAGIEPGAFHGTVRLKNVQPGVTNPIETKQIPVDCSLIPPTIFSFSPASASLGQYVDISGGGFLGNYPGVEDSTPAVTTIALSGTFTPTGAPSGNPVNVTLVPEFEEGRLVRYVLNEEDALGTLADLRTVTGVFQGSATPTTKYGSTSVSGNPANVTLGIGAVKQVVYVRFLPSYVESLRHFGLRSVEQRIRSRVIEVMTRDYGGVNAEFRIEEPKDFALYAQVDIGGPDPNGLGLIGYDNSPGKDKGNKRLYDKIGGVNAVTQEDGYPGFGGVFVESLFGFSKHPGKFAESLEVADPLFDQLFDPFRPDRHGTPVLAEDLANLDIPVLSDGFACPAPSAPRAQQIACAVWALGSMIGTTTGHEVAHSLGLADPSGSEFHNFGDEPNRLMDGGAARTFTERAELQGDGPGVFCDEDYAYLRSILPTSQPDPLSFRPICD